MFKKTRFKSHCFNRFFRVVIITYYCVVGKWRYKLVDGSNFSIS